MQCNERCVQVKLYFRMSDFTLFYATRRLACRSFDPISIQETAIKLPLVPKTDGWLLEGLPATQESSLSSSGSTWIIYRKSKYNRHVADLSGGYEKYMGKFS